MKLKKDDRVVVLGGKDKGRTGKIEKVLPRQAKVLIAGLNLFKKHVRPQGERQPGGVVEIAKPLPASRVALVCPKCGQRTRVGYRVNQVDRVNRDDTKLRICKKCQAAI